MNHLNYILKLLAMLLPFGMAGQSIHLTAGSKVIATGPVSLVLNNTGFVNDGSFTAIGSAVSFTGTAASNVSRISGNGALTFSSLTIDKAAGDVLLNKSIVINGTIMMLNGNLLLNNNTVSLGNSGKITGESDQSHITGPDGGSVVASGKLIPGIPFNPGNIGAELLTSDNLGSLTVERRHVSETLPDGAQSIDRSFNFFGSKLPVFFNVRLRFFYLDAELEGNDEAGLSVWTRSGAGNFLIPLGKDSNDIAGNRVIKNEIDQLNHFTLASDGGGPASRNIEKVSYPAGTSQSFKSDVVITGVKVFPNPSHDHFSISLFSKTTGEILIALYDQSGHLLEQKKIHCTTGENSISWNVEKYAAGVYYLSYKGQELKNSKIIKK